MNINVVKLTSIVIALLPWLGNYKFIVNGLTLGDFLLLLVFILNIVSTKRINLVNLRTPQKHLINFYIYAVIIVLLSLFFGNIFSYELVSNRTLKMGFYFIIMFFLIPGCTNFKYFLKAYKSIVYLSCFAITVQYIGNYVLGMYFEFKIPFLNYSSESAEQFDYSLSRLTSFRPDSLFLEPSHFVYYIIGYIIICLFWEKQKNPKIFEAAIITLFALMSVSSTGIFFLAVVWVYFVILLVIKKELSLQKKLMLVLIVSVLSVSVIYVFFSTDISNSLLRLSIDESSNSSSGAWNKITLGNEYFIKLDLIQKIFGIGLGNYPIGTFTTSNYFILYCTGIIGMGIIILWSVQNYLKGNHLGKVMILVTLMLFTSWYVIYSSFFVLFNMLIINDRYDKKNIQIRYE